MKKKLLLLTVALSGLVLSSCNGSHGSEKESSLSSNSIISSIISSEDSSSEASSQISLGSAFERALKKDYSNMTINVTQVYDHGQYSEFNVEYYYQGYTIIYDEAIAELGGDPYLFYHDYQGDNYLYFEPDNSASNPREAWLNKGYRDADLSIQNTYFYMPELLNNISAGDVEYSSGLYIVKTEAKTQELNSTAFSFAWYNDIQYVVFQVVDDYITTIIGLEDLNNEDDYVKIELGYFGTTTFDDSKLPPSPNEENVMEYWEYKGYDGPIVDTYIESLTLEMDASAVKDDNFDCILDIEEEAVVRSTYLPENATKHALTWVSSNEEVVKIGSNFESGARTLIGVSAGEAEIYALSEGSNVKSNVIKVKVKPLASQNKEGCIYDLTFTGLTSEGIVGVNNSLDNHLPVTVQAEKATLQSGKHSEIWPEENQVMILNPSENGVGDAILSCDFMDQQVSSLSFYYGLYYSAGLSNKDWVKEIVIETSNDGEEWTIANDVKDEVLNHISVENLKLLEVSFAPASKVRIRLKTGFTGKPFHFAFDELSFMKDENCHDHVELPETIEVTSVEISAQGNTTITEGDLLQFQSVVLPVDATDKSITWHSTNEEVATIDNGVLHSITSGTTTVYAVANNGVESNQIEVTVEEKVVINLPTGMIGKWTGEDDNNNDFTFIISDNTLVATTGEESFTLTPSAVDGSTYTLVDSDNNSLSVKLSYGNNKVINVAGKLGSHTFGKYLGLLDFNKYIALNAITLSAAQTTIVAGNTILVKATLSPTDATENELNWTSSNTNVATVDDVGYVTAVSSGTTTIIADNGNGVTGEIEITVIDKVYPTTINIIAEKTNLEVKETLQLSVDFEPNDVTDTSLTWTSSNTNIATVSKSGLVSAKAVGTVTITATGSNDVSGTIVLTITAASSKIPAGLIGEWYGHEGYYELDTVITFSADGKVNVYCEAYAVDMNFTLSTSGGNSYEFICDEDDSITLTVIYNTDSISVTLSDDNYILLSDTEFTR